MPLRRQRSASPHGDAGGAGLRGGAGLAQPIAKARRAPWPAAGRGGAGACRRRWRRRCAANAGGRARPRHRSALLAALLGALLGGLLLNLMPCVFPVLAIKVVGFTRHADDRRGHRVRGAGLHGRRDASPSWRWAALMLALRAAGAQLGWGFQLQSPAVVAALAALFTLIGLNLAGVFEFGALRRPRLAALEARHPVANAFLSGVLAVVDRLALHRAVHGRLAGLRDRPAGRAGAADVRGARPGHGAALPGGRLRSGGRAAAAAARRLDGRPSAGCMAFPMFATVAWLVWVLGQQSGIDGAGALLALLVALAAWWSGR